MCITVPLDLNLSVAREHRATDRHVSSKTCEYPACAHELPSSAQVTNNLLRAKCLSAIFYKLIKSEMHTSYPWQTC